MLSRVQENLIATLIPGEAKIQSRPRIVQLPVSTGGWEGLVSIVSALAPTFEQAERAKAQQAIAEAEAARAELEKIRLAATPEAKLKTYLPWIGGGVLILAVLVLALRKRK